MAVHDKSDVERLETAWFGDGVDHAARRAALLDEDTEERREARVAVLDALDLSLTTLGERMATLAAVAREVQAEPVHHDTILDMPAALFAEAARDAEPEPEPEPEPDAAPRSKKKKRRKKRTTRGKKVKPAPIDPELLPMGSAGWQAEVELLYNDVLRLFSLGDTDGALVSLERLLIVAPINDQIRSFLRINESKLMKLYEGVMGPWSNVPGHVGNPQAPEFFNHHAKFKTILHLVDGQRDLGAILEESYFLPLETCAVVNQLIRAKVILAHDVPA